MGDPAKFYHVVPRDTAIQVLVEGFWDSPSTWLPERPERGVWLTERPLNANDGLPPGWDTVLEVQFDRPLEQLSQWRWVTDGDAARGVPEECAWLIPAEFVNTVGRVRLLEQTELSEAEIRSALQRHEAFLRNLGRVGEQLEEETGRFEGMLRRWEPA